MTKRVVRSLPPLRRLPADLIATVLTLFTLDLVVLLPTTQGSSIRVVLATAGFLLIPGYALTAALFPRSSRSTYAIDDEEMSISRDASRYPYEWNIGGVARLAVSFGTSVAIICLIGLLLNHTEWGIQLVPILLLLNLSTIAAVGVAVVRRRLLPEADRFSVSYRDWLTSCRATFFEPASRTDGLLNILLVLGVLLAVASVGYALAMPKQGEAITEFYLMTRNDNGETTLADYPTEFNVGEGEELVLAISNHERKTESYEVVVMQQQAGFVGNNTSRRLQERELDRIHITLRNNETWIRDYRVRPTMSGERQRLVFLLYRDAAPADPTVENAYRKTILRVNVST